MTMPKPPSMPPPPAHEQPPTKDSTSNGPVPTPPALERPQTTHSTKVQSSSSLDPIVNNTMPADDRLDADGAAIIIRRELRPEHMDDPNVLRFINAYLGCRNLRDAAKESGLSVRDARALRGRKDIHRAITKVTEAAVLKYGLDPDELVESVKDIAFFDPIDLIGSDGLPIRDLREMPARARRALKSMKVKELWSTDENGIKIKSGYLMEYQFWDKTKNAELLGRETGNFKETVRQEFDVTKNMKEVLLTGRDRAAERRERLIAAQGEREVIDVSGDDESGRDGPDKVQNNGPSNVVEVEASEGESGEDRT